MKTQKFLSMVLMHWIRIWFLYSGKSCICCMECIFNVCVYPPLVIVGLISHFAFIFSDAIPETLLSILFQRNTFITFIPKPLLHFKIYFKKLFTNLMFQFCQKSISTVCAKMSGHSLLILATCLHVMFCFMKINKYQSRLAVFPFIF